MSERIRILIADDYAIVREGLRALIATEPGLELVAEAADRVQAVEKTRATKPDVILLDTMMPRKDGLGAISDTIFDQPGIIIGSILEIVHSPADPSNLRPKLPAQPGVRHVQSTGRGQ